MVGSRIEATGARADGPSPRRRNGALGMAAAALAAAGVCITLTAPPASAAVTMLNIAPPSGPGYGVTCPYVLTANVTDPRPVEFRDNGNVILGSPAFPSGNTATVTWTPLSKGWHHLQAAQYPISKGASRWVNVTGTGLNLGSSCPLVG
ncbi:MAG: hypothetical protein HOQ24_04835 [Mycobacteriaceae bacterium]|nr:hypothetical protein [Mycobacteriaceae bacterium]